MLACELAAEHQHVIMPCKCTELLEYTLSLVRKETELLHCSRLHNNIWFHIELTVLQYCFVLLIAVVFLSVYCHVNVTRTLLYNTILYYTMLYFQRLHLWCNCYSCAIFLKLVFNMPVFFMPKLQYISFSTSTGGYQLSNLLVDATPYSCCNC